MAGAYRDRTAGAFRERPSAVTRIPGRAGARAAASRVLAAIGLVLATVTAGGAQDLAAPLPRDPAIRTGTLPNGLTYFIRENARPANRAALRLVVKAGSVDEADDQRGLAHVLEHMAFNGTTHFAPGELVKYLESIGAAFGPHVNASTSFDQTIYMLDVPTDREGVLQRGFEALGDFAGGITLDPAEIDRERGVVLEEWRGRLGAETRLQEPQLAALFGESKYASRLPIGTPESLKSFPPQRLRDFYRDHYQPDRMAVIVVGDVEAAEAESLVREHFSALESRSAVAREAFPVPDHDATRYVSLSDSEQDSSSVSIYVKRPFERLETVASYRRMLTRSLAFQMLNARFSEIAREAEAPFLRASSGTSLFARTVEASTLSALVPDGRIATGLTGLSQELARVRQHGFGPAELERARESMLASFERSYNERDKSESGPLAAELIRHVLQGEAVPGIERELALARRFVPEITAAEAADMIRELFADENRVVIAVAPDKPDVPPVAAADLRDALSAGASAPVTAWRDEMAVRELMAKTPAPGAVRGRREIPEIGVTVLSLSNGVEVWLKPTTFRNDQVVFSAYAPGGLSLAPPGDYHAASLSAALVGLAGVGGLTPVDLSKLMAGKIAAASTGIGDYAQTVSGSSAPKDLETALQLVHLRFTQPNHDPAAFALLQRQLQTVLANQEQTPAFAFRERLGAINTRDHYTARSLRVGEVGTLDPERMMQFYEARFANAGDFTFFFVGAFDEATITPLLTTYLASLPSTGRAGARRGSYDLQFPASVVRETVTKGREPSSQTAITFFADTGLEEYEDHRLRAATAVLQARLRDILREELGGTYSVSVSYSSTLPEPGYGTVTVFFGSAPENVERLTTAVMTEIDRLRRDGPSAEDVRAVKETEKNEIRTALEENGYWLNSLQTMHLLGRDARQIPGRIARADSLSPENVHAAFRAYFPEGRHTIVTLVPEAAAAAPGAR